MTKEEIKTEAKRFIIDRTIGLECLAIPIEDVELDNDFENHFDKRDMADAFIAGTNLILSQLTEKDKQIDMYKAIKDDLEMICDEKDKQIEELKKDNEKTCHLADVRCKQERETYQLYLKERRERIDAEIERDDKIAELEAQNKQLQLKLTALEGETPWKDLKDKSELIKENTELKEEVDYAKNHCLFSDCEKVKRLEAQIEKLEEKLANADYQLEGRDNEIKQAKGIIRKLLSKEMHNPFEVLKIREEAEKFLEEVNG